ncbi:FK506-binding protein 15-like isoform X2 [Stegodyphus dumicola]|uniref:FK506-binding protein 15-like isoform X2 n=1 Tax=Stegodyphus dumicola TaxID=202533 RepID=UPI0015B14F89|nr:FK506-binding protein 15-like isoform X2 [Stegodyphus dumicola]
MDDEDTDFTLNAAARSRLSSLFQAETSSSDVNQALTFTAPKQPRKTENPQSSSGTLKLIHAAVVHAFKLKDGNYTNQGKLGCAILGLHEASTYKFLLYKGKQVQVTSCSIIPSFTFHVQPNNYANIYDENKENWSLNFLSEAELSEFAKQIALAKANCQGKNLSLVIQDLLQGEGPGLESGDSAEVKYIGWLLQNYSFGQVFDSNMSSESFFRVRLGKSKVIKGWNEGLLGAQKGCKRLLIVPPNLAYGSEGMGNTIPPHSTLIFEIHVVKVKISRDASHSPSPVKVSDNIAEKKPEVPPRHSISQEDNIRMRGASISEQLTQSPKKDKAQLISRMAKMGTATLPFQGAVAAQVSSDSENEEEISAPPVTTQSSSRTSSPKPFSKPRSRTNSGTITFAQVTHPQPLPANTPFQMTQQSSQVSLYAQSAMPVQQPYVTSAPFPAYPPQISSPFQVPQTQFPMHGISGVMPSIPTSMADAHLPLLITETRSQNAEVRLSLSKITDKVDSVIQKVDDLRLQQGKSTGLSHMHFMEGTILLQNIQRIIQENQQLKEDVEIRNSKIQALNEKICDLLQRNQRFFEESTNIMEQRKDSLQAANTQSHVKLLSLEEEKAKLSSELINATAKLKNVEADLLRHENQEKELQQKLLESEREFKELKDRQNINTEKESLLNSLCAELENFKHENRLLNTKLQSLEEKQKELQDTNESLEKLLLESKQKIQEIKSKAASDLENLNAAHEEEIQSFQKKLRERTSSLNEASNTTNEPDQEKENLRQELESTLEKKDELESIVYQLKKQLTEREKEMLQYTEKNSELQSELEKSLIWKKKYDIFYEKTCALKERYENQIVELMKEVKHLQSSKHSGNSPDFSAEIKKVMNALYKLLQGKFEPNTAYPGAKVLEMTLQTIRGLTFQMLEMKRKSSTDSSEQISDPGKCSVDDGLKSKSNALEKKTENEISDQLISNETEVSSLPQNGFPEENAIDSSFNKEQIESSTVSNISEHSISENQPEPSPISKDQSDSSASSTTISNSIEQTVSENQTEPMQMENALNNIRNDDTLHNNLGTTAVDKSEADGKLKTETKEAAQDSMRASPDQTMAEICAPFDIYRSLFWNSFYAILLGYVVFWIGAWVHGLATTTSPSL